MHFLLASFFRMLPDCFVTVSCVFADIMSTRRHGVPIYEWI